MAEAPSGHTLSPCVLAMMRFHDGRRQRAGLLGVSDVPKRRMLAPKQPQASENGAYRAGAIRVGSSLASYVWTAHRPDKGSSLEADSHQDAAQHRCLTDTDASPTPMSNMATSRARRAG